MAFVGQNGAGKSTMIKVLTGAPIGETRARSLFAGQLIDFTFLHAAQRRGISTIHQEINLVPFRSVAENVFLGREHRRRGCSRLSRMNPEAAELLRRFAVA